MGIARDNIRRKRAMKRQRRIKMFFRLLAGMVVGSIVIAILGWISIQIYGWGSEFYANQKEIYDGYLQRKALRQASYDTRFDGYTNVLLVGLDEGREDSGPQADSIVVVSMEKESGEVSFIIVPRYTVTMIPGRPNPEALNNAYFYGGVKLVQQSVANLLGITLHHYAVLSPAVLAEIVDSIDGIDIYVENDMNYEDAEGDLHIHINKGLQHMDGQMAQLYLRYRNDELGSVGRLYRHQLFLKALYEKVASPDVLAKLPQIIELVNSKIESTAEVYDTAEIVSVLSKIDTSELVAVTVPGQLAADGSGAWIYDKGKTDEKINELFPPPVVPEQEKKDEKKEGWFNW